ncbi:hypothetical protein Vadar_015581 [Vaccinium darrowii]|uniref:Uncharacterized protein n=1 Tax=Vaccinium darrowii TaxID=229202 RepID=A0ACB7Y7M6_9ERIC|nr:hypothetical protein Vadar_015581 [Vaccinium darrowii]
MRLNVRVDHSPGNNIYTLNNASLQRAILRLRDCWSRYQAKNKRLAVDDFLSRKSVYSHSDVNNAYGFNLPTYTKDLWVQADIDGNGVLDYKEFQQQIWNPTWSEQRNEICNEVWEHVNSTEQTIGFSVKNAVLFPTEVEKGLWPEDYSLSDHARLTVVFSPVGMLCRLIS